MSHNLLDTDGKSVLQYNTVLVLLKQLTEMETHFKI